MGSIQSGWLQTSTPQSRATGKNYFRRMPATGRFQNPHRRQFQHATDSEYPWTDSANAGMRKKFDLPPHRTLNA